MNKRGRKSTASLSVVTIDVNAQRPDPPSELTATQAKVWRETVETTPAGWFRAGDHLLTAYCRHVVSAGFLAGLIDKCRPDIGDKDGLGRLGRLLAMRARETAAISSLATRMRLTKQARAHSRSAGRAFDGTPGGKPPWEV